MKKTADRVLGVHGIVTRLLNFAVAGHLPATELRKAS